MLTDLMAQALLESWLGLPMYVVPLFIKSFIWLCLEFLPICNPHDNPWRPLASTSLPQMHLYGWQSNILPTKSANYWGMNHRAWIIICYYWDVLSK